MNAAALLELALTALQQVLATAIQNGLAKEIVDAIKGAVDRLLSVQGSDVTYAQLEALRIPLLWPDVATPTPPQQ